MVQLVMDLPLLRVKPMKDTSQCMNPRFPLSGAREFPEYISSERKLSKIFRYTAIAQESPQYRRFVNYVVKNKDMCRKYWFSIPLQLKSTICEPFLQIGVGDGHR